MIIKVHAVRIQLLWITMMMITSLGCGGENITQPGVLEPATELTQELNTSDSSIRQLWGMWELAVEKNTGEYYVVPIREGSFHLNALKFLEPPAFTGFSITPGTLHVDPVGNTVEVDVRITHPFPGYDRFSAFDLRVILLTPGSEIPFSDHSLIFPSSSQPTLVNADGMTRWWNPKEFVGSGIGGFIQGMLGRPGGAGVFTATINYYKYFADGLGPNDVLADVPGAGRGVFRAGSVNSRHFDIHFGPNEDNWLKFQYAVDAGYMKPVNLDSPVIPDDFPIGANAPEGIGLEVAELANTLWWLQGIGMGGHLRYGIKVYTWRPKDIARVTIEIPGLLSGVAEATAVPGSGGSPDDPTYSIYMVDIQPNILSSTSTKECLVTVESTYTYTQEGLAAFFGPSGAKMSNYHRRQVEISFVPPLVWEVVDDVLLQTQPVSTVADFSVVGSGSKQGVYFFGENYQLMKYPLDYSTPATCATKLSGFFGFTEVDLYGLPPAMGRFDLAQTGQFVASSISNAPSPIVFGGLKRDYVSFFQDIYNCNGQLPVQVILPDPSYGYFNVRDVCANWETQATNAKIYWLQADDPEEPSPPNPEVTVILGVYQYAFSGNPFSGDLDYITGSVVPAGNGDGEINVDNLIRFAVDSKPQGLTGSADLIGWFLESTIELECFSIVSIDDTGSLNESLATITNFAATPRDICVLPTYQGGYSAYNWVAVLEEGAGGTWIVECFNQLGEKKVCFLGGIGYPANIDMDPATYQLHIWYSESPGGALSAMILNLTQG